MHNKYLKNTKRQRLKLNVFQLCAFTLLSLLLCSSSTFALVLEDLPKAQLHEKLSGKKVGFYIGSFDPIHKGHEQVVSSILNQNLVDYCLVYPAWGGDKYKQRTDVDIRFKMLFILYKDNPQIIVTQLSPIELQDLLTVDSSVTISEKPAVKSAINETKYIGVLGSDTAINTVADKKKLSIFMRGIKIPEKYCENTIGGIIALPVSEFIVSMREGDDIEFLENMIGERPIIATLKLNDQEASSTKVRHKIKHNEDATDLISPEVLEVIKSHRLYK